MSRAILPARTHCNRRQRLNQRSHADCRETFHRRLLYESLEDRRLLTVGDIVVSIQATDATAGDVNGGTGTFEISRSDSTTNRLVVNLYANGGSAKLGADFSLTGGAVTTVDNAPGYIQVTIPAGSESADLTLTVLGGSQPTEAAILQVMPGNGTPPSNYLVSNVPSHCSARVNITISHPDTTTPLVSVAATNSNAAEPSTNGEYTITRSGGGTSALGSDLAVAFSMTGSATRGTDYNLVTGWGTAQQTTLTGNTVTIPAGQQSVIVALAVDDDSVVEPMETATMAIQSGNGGYNIGSPASADVSIEDDDAVSVSVTPTTPNAAEPSTNGMYTITRYGGGATGLNSALVVNFSVSGNATIGSDYHLIANGAQLPDTTTNSVTIPAQQTSVQVILAVIDDTVSEPTETATLTVQPNGTAYNIGGAANASVTIMDDDPILVTVSAPDPLAGEPSDNGSYRITRTGNTTSALAVSFTTGGDATLGTDYRLLVGGTALTGNTVTIPAGQSCIDITLAVIDDTLQEPTETAAFTVPGGTGYVVGVSSSVAITIKDNETTTLSVSATDPDAGEHSNNGTFRISRTGDTTSPLVVDFTMGGTANRCTDLGGNLQGMDYALKTADGTVLAGNSVTLAAGQSYVDLTLAVLADSIPESLETAILTLTIGASTGNSATITIADDGSPRQTVIAEDANGTPGQTIAIPVQYAVTTNNNQLSGLGLRLFYKSSFMTFNSLSSVLQTGLVSQQTPVDDTADLDGDPSTDKYILVAWADLAGNWPNQALPTPLYAANFTLASTLSDAATSIVNFMAASNAVGYGFQPLGITVTASASNLDVDGNGVCDALTDGVLIMRYLFDPNGSWTTAGAIGVGATRTTHDQIKSYLDSAATMLDVDGNGQADALTDGMLIMRYLFDPSGAWTTDGLIGPGATRTIQADIKSFLDLFIVAMPATSSPFQMSGSALQEESSAMMSTVSASNKTTGNQIVTPSQTEISAAPGTHVSFDVNYSTSPSDPTLSGLGLRMYFNSSLLTFNGLSNVLANGAVSQEASQDDTNNSDGDPSTDKYVLVGWADLGQNWPGAATQRLYTADFTLNSGATGAAEVNFNASSTAAGWSFVSTPVTITPNAGPTIGSVVVSTAKKVISWNAADADGLSACSLKIDGVSVAQINGPYKATSGLNYSGAIGALAAGNHKYVITATDNAGHSSSFSGSFDVVAVANDGPAIGSVVVSTAKKVISWNAADADGVAACSFKIDNVTVAHVNGPYKAASGANYSAALGTLAAGNHTYVIAATDKAGHSSSCSGSFDVVAVANDGPTIASVVVSEARKVISWNAADGVAACSLKIDGVTVARVNGPYKAAFGANYSAALGALAAGNHKYTITATDKSGHSSTALGTFSLSGSGKSVVSNAVFAALAQQTAASAKVDWLHDDSDLVSV
jgi:hypothetical protein